MSLLLLATTSSATSHFQCMNQGGNNYRPYYVQTTNGGADWVDWSETSHGLLGQNAMTSFAECEQAVLAANEEFGVICSRTGLDGWKPTLYTGTEPGRADFGYLGGSSIMDFDDCLLATESSSAIGVCYWGGSDWWVGPIDREGFVSGPYNTLDDCVVETMVGP